MDSSTGTTSQCPDARAHAVSSSRYRSFHLADNLFKIRDRFLGLYIPIASSARRSSTRALRLPTLLPLPLLARANRAPSATDALPPELLADPPPDIRHRLQVDGIARRARRPRDVVRRALQRVEHVFRGDVARGAGGVGAAAEAADGGVDGAHAALQRGHDVGDARSECVVELDMH
jgi:hypothetical protein